jgi:hypothetical protein
MLGHQCSMLAKPVAGARQTFPGELADDVQIVAMVLTQKVAKTRTTWVLCQFFAPARTL